MKEHIKKLELSQDRLEKIKKKKDLDSLVYKQKELEKKVEDSDFWKDTKNAQKIMKERNYISEEIKSISEIDTMIKDGLDIAQFAEKEHDTSVEDELKNQIATIDKKLDAVELETYLSGKFDSGDAILSIHAGQGGTEACDWTEMLKRMYTRYFEKQGWTFEVTNEVHGNEAGISTVTIEVHGKNAFGYLRNEHGTHRLVRISPFNAQGLRQTSFAGVEVGPIIDEDPDIEIKDDDIDFAAVRSGGPGGQNVNKVSTSVRVTHVPTGITVSSSAGRSQLQNRKAAMNMLKAKLYRIKQEEIKKEKSDVTGEYKVAGWGNQIRNYVLQPYKLVKDLRTKVESSDPEDILDGHLDEFIEAEIKI